VIQPQAGVAAQGSGFLGTPTTIVGSSHCTQEAQISNSQAKSHARKMKRTGNGMLIQKHTKLTIEDHQIK
jgi:hypothetical protein